MTASNVESADSPELDTDQLRKAIQQEYTEVALLPHLAALVILKWRLGPTAEEI